jgi:uncharacterized protein (DUF305 family)
MKQQEAHMHHHGKSSMMDLMQQMNSKMESTQMTGDADHDFAQMMIIHHQAAIDMARMEMDAGQDTGLKTLAKKIIDDQTKEINELQQWLQQHH